MGELGGKGGKLGILGCGRKGKLRGKWQKIEGKLGEWGPGLWWEGKIEGEVGKLREKEENSGKGEGKLKEKWENWGLWAVVEWKN